MPLVGDSYLAEMPASRTRARAPSILELMRPITKGMEALDDFVKARPEFSIAVKCGVASVHRAAYALFHDMRNEYKTMLKHSKNERRKAKKEATKRMREMAKQKEQATKSTVGNKAKDQAIEERADFYDMVRLGRTLAGLPPTPPSVKGVRKDMGKRTRIRGKRQP